MKAYRFTTKFSTFVKEFETEAEAFDYATSLTDGPDSAVIEKWVETEWLGWNVEFQKWINV